MSEIFKWSIAETAAKLRSREVSVTEVTEAHIARMEDVNPVINAITHRVDEALDVARSLDEKGIPEDAGDLYGIPVTTKINVDQAGYPNSNGISDFAKATGPHDSPVVSNLKASGAVIIGRTNTPELSMRWFTSNPLHGVSRNPWNPEITPGGSSGAAAGAVACGIGSIAHGNDLGGSLRYPAFCCGVATIRPSAGRIAAMNPNQSEQGKERGPFTQLMAVQGPIARSVADVRAGLAAMEQRDPRDPTWVPAPDSGRDRTRKPVIGYAVNPFRGPLDPALEDGMNRALQGFRDAGYETRECVPPHADALTDLWGRLMFTEEAHLTRPAMEKHVSPEMREYLKAFRGQYEVLDTVGLLKAMQERVVYQRAWSQMFDEIDLLLMPTSLAKPFVNDIDLRQTDKIPEILAAQAPLLAVNVLGLPSVALPTHLDGGIPIGVQLVAPLYDDRLALDVAEKLEAEIGTIWQQMPDPAARAEA